MLQPMRTDSTEAVLTAIDDALKARGMSRREFARQLGWNRMRIQRLLAGDTRLTVTDLTDIAAALDVPVAQLLPTAGRAA